MSDISFKKCQRLSEITLVKTSIEHDIANMVSSINPRYIQRISIGFVNPVTDTQLESAIESKTWERFDNAIALLAEQTLNDGRRLQLELHVCGNPSTGLFDLMLPRFMESGCLRVVRTSYIGKGSDLRLPPIAKVK